MTVGQEFVCSWAMAGILRKPGVCLQVMADHLPIVNEAAKLSE